MNGYFSVFDSNKNKIADCGSLRDALNLVNMRGDGHYYQYTPIYDIVDIEDGKKYLSTNSIIINSGITEYVHVN